jgi:Dynamin family
MESLGSRISDFGEWRHAVSRRLHELAHWAEERGLADVHLTDQLRALEREIDDEKVVVAFVAEFSRGKSELINAIFFANYGRRILPATAGRTTMCPSELVWDEAIPVGIRLLPVETRLETSSLADWKANISAWHTMPFELDKPDSISDSLQRVADTMRVPPHKAQSLGLYSPERKDETVTIGTDGMVEIPKWRHAIINFPHPLLKQGLVILDTPGLNAIGAEPELTLSLLPSAHAIVFILAADAGVTKSDLEIWQRFLSPDAHANASEIAESRSRRYVVLNKIDGLWDELSTDAQIETQIKRQCAESAHILGIDPAQVLPVSAQKGLIGKVKQDDKLLKQSRITQLEDVLSEGIVMRRREIVAQAISARVAELGSELDRQLGSQKREYSDQLSELRMVRGKNRSVMSHLQKRIEHEKSEFETSQGQVQAMRAVHLRLLKEAHSQIAVDKLKADCDKLRSQLEAGVLRLNAKDLFSGFFKTMRDRVLAAETRCVEIQQMLAGQLNRLNTEHAFSLPLPKSMSLRRLQQELDTIERGYIQHVSLTNFLKLQQASYLERLLRSVYSRLRTAFEVASRDIDSWNKASVAGLESQLKERRRSFSRRVVAVDRIEEAISGLQERIDDAKVQETQLQSRLEELRSHVNALVAPQNTLRTKDSALDVELAA